jgi:dethiobiotin synthetase
MRRVAVVGTGTGVGKSYVVRALARALRARGAAVLALKPIETGAPFLDAKSYDEINPIAVAPHPLYGFAPGISPHLAARQVAATIDVESVTRWCEQHERRLAEVVPHRVMQWSLVETAGGVLTPLGPSLRNFDLVLALEVDVLLLVAADVLGALNAVSTSVVAMRALGRAPDLVALSAPEMADASSGSNAAELVRLSIASGVHEVLRGGDADGLAESVLARVSAS